MAEPVGIPDILAFVDVLTKMSEEASEGKIGVEHAAALLDALAGAKKALGDAIAFLEAAAVTQLEGQKKLVGNTVYSVHDDYKIRPDHDTIDHRVVELACVDVNGERVTSPWEAAARAVFLYRELYVAPSTKPKAAGLKAIRLSAEEATIKEHTGRSLKVTVIE